MRPINPTTAMELLTCFRRRQLTLTRDMYDRCFDSVTAELERCNNETHRLMEETDVPEEN